MENRTRHRKATVRSGGSGKTKASRSECSNIPISESRAPSPTNISETSSTKIPSDRLSQDGLGDVKDLSPDDISLPLSLITGLRRKNSSNSSGVGSGNNSDNSALVSLGNNSFGFNFDSEDGGNSPSDPSDKNDSEGDTKENDDDNNNEEEVTPSESAANPPSPNEISKSERKMKERDAIKARRGPCQPQSPSESKSGSVSSLSSTQQEGRGRGERISEKTHSTVSSLTCDDAPNPNRSGGSLNDDSDKFTKGLRLSNSEADAAAAAVENLQNIVNSSSVRWKFAKPASNEGRKASPRKHTPSKTEYSTAPQETISGTKRDADDYDDYDDSDEGYDSDNEACSSRVVQSEVTPSAALSSNVTPTPVPASSSAVSEPPKKKAKKVDNKREERNAREKERSFRISKQINELRTLLSTGGVIVPKGTKSSVLTEAANYIRMLQQHQYYSELDRQRLVQQVQMIGSGSMGPQAANAIRHVAAQNGVWSLGNFGGVPPRSAMSYYQQPQVPPFGPQATPLAPTPQQQPQPQDVRQVNKVEDHEYRNVFKSCAVGMAIASMGGAFIDCNQLFCKLSEYTKQEICSMTIFNLTSRADLQHAFNLISQMISPPAEGRPQEGNPPPCILQGSMKNRNDLGLSVALIKGDDGIAKCFCVTLVQNASSPFSMVRPTPATADAIQENQLMQQVNEVEKGLSGSMGSPAFTTG